MDCCCAEGDDTLLLAIMPGWDVRGAWGIFLPGDFVGDVVIFFEKNDLVGDFMGDWTFCIVENDLLLCFWGDDDLTLVETVAVRRMGLTGGVSITTRMSSFKKSGSCPYSAANMALNNSCGSRNLAAISGGILPEKVTVTGSEEMGVEADDDDDMV